MSYAPFGPLTGLTFGNGLALSRTLDQQYRLTDQTTGTIQDIDFTLDAVGNVDAITDWVNTSQNLEVQLGCAFRLCAPPRFRGIISSNLL